MLIKDWCQKTLRSQPFRYVINGVVATSAHFLILSFFLKTLIWSSAGIANFFAAIFGITISFLGSRYFVFKHSTETLISQLYRFLLLYVSIALIHGAILYVWVDVYHLYYVTGFMIATFIQIVGGYIGNKKMVFKV